MRQLLFAFAVLFVAACRREEPTDLQVISRDAWKNRNTKDSVLSISKYIETPGYTHYWVVLHKKPYAVDTGLLNTLEAVDDRTIYQNKMQRVSDDYKRMLRKGLIKKVPGPTGGNEFAGSIYIFRKGPKQQFTVVTVPELFEALHQQDLRHEPRNDAEQQRNYEAADSLLFKN